MRDTARAEVLLSLFTSRERAAAIAGDLTEERAHGGTFRFWLDVLGTTSALWRAAVTGSPLRVLALAASACALLFAALLVGVAGVFLFPVMGSTASWIMLSFFWWGGALATGALVVRIAPSRGMAVSATLAAVAALLALSLAARALMLNQFVGDVVLFCTTGLLACVPLVIGAAMARRRMVVKNTITLEEQL